MRGVGEVSLVWGCKQLLTKVTVVVEVWVMGSNTGKCPLLDNFLGYICEWVKLGNTTVSIKETSRVFWPGILGFWGGWWLCAFTGLCKFCPSKFRVFTDLQVLFSFLLLFIVCPILFKADHISVYLEDFFSSSSTFWSMLCFAFLAFFSST